MNATDAHTRPRNGRRLRITGILGGLGIVLALIVWRQVTAGAHDVDLTLPTFTAQSGPLTISVLEAGTVKAREQIILKSEVEGRASIIYLIEEGTRVHEGDLLVELDASGMEDDKIEQEIRLQNSEAAFIGARENLAVVKNQAQSDTDQAQLTLKFAQQDLRKYKEGEYPNQLTAAQQEITLREQELEVARQRLEWSQKLVDEEYISQTEFRDDQLKKERADQNLVLAKNALMLLQEFTYQRQIDQLESDVRQAQMALERTERKAKANVAQADADLKAKEAEFKQQQMKLEKLLRQISKAKIYAPADGLVIYATTARRGGFRGGSQQPLDEGQEVFERQELIYLPVGNETTVEVDIHEASLKKLRLGLPAIITVDALPGRRFLGHLSFIAPLPDSQSMWMNPDLKVYSTLVDVDDLDPALRSGMSCKVEIIVAQYKDAVYIPVQAVVNEGGQTCVYVIEHGKSVRRTVKIGLDNNRMIRILEGVAAGEVVLLEPPLKNAARDAARPEATEPNGAPARDSFQSRVRRSLEEARSRPATPTAPTERKSSNPANMTSEQREAMRKRLESMSPEERQKLRERMQRGSGGGGAAGGRPRGSGPGAGRPQGGPPRGRP